MLGMVREKASLIGRMRVTVRSMLSAVQERVDVGRKRDMVQSKRPA